MRVPLGYDGHNKEITSCVILPPGEKEEARRLRREGFTLREGPEDLGFRALLAALKSKGGPAPLDIEALAYARVVETKVWFAEFRKLTHYDSEDERQRIESARRALKRVEERFIKWGIIGKNENYVWHSGKPIRGFRETFPPEERRPQEAKGADFGKLDVGDII